MEKEAGVGKGSFQVLSRLQGKTGKYAQRQVRQAAKYGAQSSENDGGDR